MSGEDVEDGDVEGMLKTVGRGEAAGVTAREGSGFIAALNSLQDGNNSASTNSNLYWRRLVQ